MAYKYSHFIPQNAAPKGAKRIGVYKDGKRVCSIPLGKLAQPTGTKRYSFGLVSDTHLCPEASNGETVAERFDIALSWFELKGAAFVAHCGDMVNVGFENPKGTYNPEQFAEYRSICNLHPNLPVYACSGNHESYNEPVVTYLDEYKQYVGHDLNFTVAHENDVFIFLGMPKSNTLYVDGGTLPVPELAWLESQLTANADKRCFVFIHVYMDGDSGDTLDKNPNDLLPEGYTATVIKNALKKVIVQGG